MTATFPSAANRAPGPATRRRAVAYLGVGLALAAAARWAGSSDWSSGAAFHTLLEALAALLAAFVAVVALIRYRVRPGDLFLLLAAGFTGVALLDGLHAVATSAAVAPHLPSALPALVPWTWLASRVFLGGLACAICLGSSTEGLPGRLRPGRTCGAIGALVVAVLLLLARLPLPRALYPELPLPRPQELVPALLFLAALAGCLRLGRWRHDVYEHWLVLSLIAGLAAQALFMPWSGHLFDAAFDLAHVLKILSYGCLLAGLLVSSQALLRRAEEADKQLRLANEALRLEVEERGRAEAQLRDLAATLEQRVGERTGELQAAVASAVASKEQAETAGQLARRSTAALRSSEQRYRSLLASAPYGILVTGENGRIEVANNELQVMFGYREEELIGQSVEILLPERLHRGHVRHRGGFAARRSRRSMGAGLDLFGRRKDGGEFPVDVALSPVRLEGRALVTAIVMDITERRRRRRREQALHRVRERIWKMTDLDGLPEVVQAARDSLDAMGIDHQGMVVYVGPDSSAAATAEVYCATEAGVWSPEGGDPPGPIGAGGPLLAEPQQHPDLTTHDPLSLRPVLEDLCRRTVGSAVQLPLAHGRLTIAGREPRELGSGDLDSAAALAEVLSEALARAGDLTALARKEAELRLAQKMEAVGLLAGGVAHDFNNLLTVITGYSQSLLRGARGDDGHRRDGLEQIQRAGERAATLVRQLLAFSRRQVLQPEVLDLNRVVADTGKLLGRLLGDDIELRLRPAADLGRTEVDPGQMEQVIVNLAVNARDAMPEGGALTIETGNLDIGLAGTSPGPPMEPGAYVHLSVSDTGHGMDESTRTRIFEPFFTTKEPDRGTGLGLSTVYGIVQQSGGYIRADSAPGRGSCFRVYLPRCPEASGPTRAGEPRPEPAARGGSERVLIVDDDQAVRQVICDILSGYGYQVLAAGDGQQAQRLARDRAPVHLLVTDLLLPGTDGRRLAERVGAESPGTRVMFVTGRGDHVLASGPLPGPLLLKPFLAEQLAGKVREVLDAPPRPAAPA